MGDLAVASLLAEARLEPAHQTLFDALRALTLPANEEMVVVVVRALRRAGAGGVGRKFKAVRAVHPGLLVHQTFLLQQPEEAEHRGEVAGGAAPLLGPLRRE